jgi:hypothetical protein
VRFEFFTAVEGGGGGDLGFDAAWTDELKRLQTQKNIIIK